jgi:hypothetical protein
VPQFHFHVQDGECLPDDVGMELPDLTAARREAVRYAAEVLKGDAERFWNLLEWELRVTDGEGMTLFMLHVTATEAPTLGVSHLPRSSPT